MEAWKDELYHYGVRGMKWKNKKKNGSAIAKQIRKDGISNLDSAMERASARGTEWGSKHPSGLSGDDRLWIKQMNKQNAKARNTARAIEKGRPSVRARRNLDLAEQGKGLFRRGSGLKTDKPASGGYNRKKPSSAQTSFRRTRKDRAAKYVKRVLS
jgi:hypothetical protein